MFVLIGTLVVFGSIIVGYTMHGGHLAILLQVTEFMAEHQPRIDIEFLPARRGRPPRFG